MDRSLVEQPSVRSYPVQYFLVKSKLSDHQAVSVSVTDLVCVLLDKT